jgi:hypothetical protein
MSYVDNFLNFRCAGDIIGVIGPMKKYSKEISEMMGILKIIRPWILEKPMHYQVLDLCSGNALLPVTVAHLLPTINNIAMDKRKRTRDWHKVRKFTYCFVDINDILYKYMFQHPTILTAIHPCTELAEKVIKIYKETDVIRKLVLMPCCADKFELPFSENIEKKLGGDLLWAMHLNALANGRLIKDNKVLSPKNYIIIAEKD